MVGDFHEMPGLSVEICQASGKSGRCKVREHLSISGVHPLMEMQARWVLKELGALM